MCHRKERSPRRRHIERVSWSFRSSKFEPAGVAINSTLTRDPNPVAYRFLLTASLCPMFSLRSSTFLILGTVVLMIGMQIVAKYLPSGNSLNRQRPGPTRGDLILTDNALPSELVGWSRIKFNPAPRVDELPEGQYWWVHQWVYSNKKSSAIVSFDQLGEDQWHELTYCYRVLDWTILNRTVYEDSNGDAPFVVAELTKDPDQSAILVFSVFFEDGSWSMPPSVDLTNLNKWRQPSDAAGAIERVADRITPTHILAPVFTSPTSGHTRAFQCQVLVSRADRDTSSELASAIQLHLESRQHFRSQWLASDQVKMQSSEFVHHVSEIGQ